MQLTESIQIHKGSELYRELDHVCFLSKNLYNASLYAVRQHFFNTGKFLNYAASNGQFIQSHNPDYYALPTKVSQQTMQLVDRNFKSFFGLLKTDGCKARIPKYLEKNGRYVTVFTNQAISRKYLRKGLIKLSGINNFIKIRRGIENIQQVRIVPRITRNCYDVEIIYNVIEKDLMEDNGNYAAIDLGLSNLATVSFNHGAPFIINGRPLKSINQYYNKKRSKACDLKSNKSKSLNRKRENKIRDYLHKSSRYLVNQLVSRNVHTLVIGKNDGWKQEINIGKKNNQNFVFIPFEKFIWMLEYKCRLEGITVIKVEESYTSKCSFIDNEEICFHETYKGERFNRGLFRSSKGKIINADLNGSLNIMRNAVGEKAFCNANYFIEVRSTPVVVTPLK